MHHGSILKRLACRESLQMISNRRISTASELYDWANKEKSLPNISVLYKNTQDYEEASKFLEPRFQKCKTISGTHGIHCIEPVEDNNLRVKTYSYCKNFKIVSFNKREAKRVSKCVKK